MGYLGIDLHRNRFTVCKIGKNSHHYHATVEMVDLEKFAKTLKTDDEVAVEMTTNTKYFIPFGYYFSRAECCNGLSDYNFRVVVRENSSVMSISRTSSTWSSGW